MKKTLQKVALLSVLLYTLAGLNVLSAQFTARWALTANSAVTNFTGPVNTQAMTIGAMFTSGGYSAAGYKCQPPTVWSQSNIDGYNLDFPLSPNAGYDITITDLKDTSKTSGSSGNNMLSLAYQVDGAGPWISFGTPQAATSGGTSYQSFSGLNQTFFNGHTYILRMYMYAADSTATSKSRSVTIKGVTVNGTTTLSGTPSTVATGPVVISSITKYTATGTGTITLGTIPVSASGVCWNSTGATPTIYDSHSTFTGGGTAIGAGTGGDMTGLVAGTNYCYRAYVTTAAGTVYGDPKVCFTTAAATAPILSTATINVLSSVSASSGGNIADSGGVAITSSGICWNTTGNPTVSDNKTTDGNATNYTSLITGLLPCTKYYVKAYAVNSLGTSYGNELSFTTACVPSLLATPGTLNFGNVPVGTSSTLTYILTGALLTPASGNITVTAPAGYLISYNGGAPASTLSIPYTGGALPATTITVTVLTKQYGYVNGIITHAGGGAVLPNIQYVNVNALGSQASGVYSNVGIDFWTGFGFVEEMSSNKANMSVYIAAGDQDAVVNVDIPGLGWSYYGNPITVAAHTVFEVTGFPTATPDSRLYFTGLSNRAVHVESTTGVPVSVWTYTSSSDNTAAGCMNFPTNTWNSQYTVQAFGGYSNQPYPNSYFFVIAKDDKTVVTITPSADIVDSSTNTIFKDNTAGFVKYPAGVPFNITLNKGQVFTGISTLSGTGTGIGGSKAFSADLSGTKISTDCKSKIAVFGGNGRCLVDTSTVQSATNFQTVTVTTGSDNLMQQMFPNSAWGTHYLSVPTKTMEDNYYRVYVQDSSTKVTVNGILLDTLSLVNKLYYQLSGSSLTTGDIKLYDTLGNHFMDINANKAISVSQFIVAGAISSDKSNNAFEIGNNGKGDPEMIILSPIQQSINSVTVATPSFKNNGSGGNYINVVIPKEGVSSFKIFSDTTTYFLADTASYSVGLYDINSSLKYHSFRDSSILLVDTGATSYVAGYAYASAPALTSIDSAFRPYPSNPNYAYARFKVSIGSSYTMLSDVGFNAIAYGMDAGESYGFNAGTNLKLINTVPGQPLLISISDSIKSVKQQDPSNLKSCLSIPFHFNIALSFKPDSLVWNFNVAGTPNIHISPNATQHQIAPPAYDSAIIGLDSIKYYFYALTNPSGNVIKYTFDKLGTYPVQVIAYSKTTSIVILDPCTVDTTNGISKNTYNFTVDVTKGVHPEFTPKYATCSTDTTYKFFDNTWDEFAGTDTAFIIGRVWNFGNGKKDTTNKKTVTTSYLNSGIYPLQLIAIDKLGCISDTVINQSIKLKPIPTFSVSIDTICAGSAVTFIDHSATIGKGVLDKISTWDWNYGNLVTKTYTDSIRKSNTYNSFGTYPVSLKVTNGVGCDSSYTFKNVYVSANPVPDFVFSTDVCLNAISQFTNLSTIAYGHSLNYIWDFGDTTKLDSSILTKDSATAIHTYKGNGAYNVTLTAYNTYKNNLTCIATKTKTLDVLYTLIPLQIDSIYHEGFEPSKLNSNPVFFPPVSANGQRWHIFPVNSSGYTSTWSRDSIVNIVPSEANSSAWAHNYGTTVKQTDGLNTPVFGLPVYSSKNDSLFLKFDVAAKTNFSSGGSNRDTLEVQMSSKCNDNWVTIYKKWGADLQTFHDASVNTPGEFKVNNKSQWRTDSINITALHDTLGNKFSTMIQNGDSVRFKFVNHNNNENNIYLDNINIYVNVDKGQGFYTTTIPFDTALVIHDYDFRNLKSISIYDMTGRLIHTTNYNTNLANSVTSSRFTFRPGYNGIPYMANGMYVVVMTYSDQQRRVFNFLKQ